MDKITDRRFSRSEIIFGKEAMARLYSARVAVFGLGGVGGAAAEALARAGVGTLDLFDKDTVCPTNINRQIIAHSGTVGMYKTEAARERIALINPAAAVNINTVFYLPENAGEYDFTVYDYTIDAIDTVTAKIELILRADAAGVPIISCMGAGNKLHPELLTIADIYQTSVCPLARVMRGELRARGIKALKVVYSTEEPAERYGDRESESNENAPENGVNTAPRKTPPGSCSFVPPTAGLIMAGEVVRHITGRN